MTRIALAAAVAAACSALLASNAVEASEGPRAMGVDVSRYQGTINWASVQASGKSFAFFKGTEADYYTDTFYAANLSKLSATTMVFGAYHFARPTLPTTVGTTVTMPTDAALVADAIGEANYFVNNARGAMQPGNILPTLDLEAGDTLTNAKLTTWTVAFSDQMYTRLGVRPMVYLNSNYAANVNAGTAASPTGVSSLPLWWARVPTSTTGYTDAEVSDLARNPTTSYGAWGSSQAVWDFWQYSWVGSVPGIGGNVDLDVAHGDVEYVKDLTVPGLWTDAAGGNFGSAGKWNNLDGVAGTLYFPNANSRAIISLPDASPTITYDGANRTVRSLQLDEAMRFTSGTLTSLQYAKLTAATQVNGGGLTAASIDNGGVLTVAGGAVTSAGAITGTGTTAVSLGTLNAASLAQASLTITGGTTAVTNALTTTAGTSVSAGTLNVGSMPSGTLAVSGSGLAKFNGTGGSKVASLTVANTADLDVGLTELAVDYATSSPLATIRTALAAGAIGSNKAVAGVTGVGAVESKAKFGSAMATAAFGDVTSVTVDATAVLVALALFGDTNFDRVVNLADLATFAAHFMSPAAVWNWQDGDFTYDGGVTRTDLALLRGNYLRTLNADGTYSAANTGQFDVDVAAFANIPEPASFAALGLAGLALRRRRRA